jgi:hypothetical protein
MPGIVRKQDPRRNRELETMPDIRSAAITNTDVVARLDRASGSDAVLRTAMPGDDSWCASLDHLVGQSE